MKRGEPLERRTRLRADPAKVRAWQDRSRKPLRAKSAKRAALRPAEEAARDAVFARDGGCVMRTARVDGWRLCWGIDTFHHLEKAAHGGELSEANGVCLCLGCNGFVEDEPLLAKEIGLVVNAAIDHAEARRRRAAHGLIVR